LVTTGISIERIPLISEMDEALKKIGWRAVAINGFIPPSVFLEFQSLRILAIACDIRKLENIGYTPSPDIIHEAAGHVPIVEDEGYRQYLEAYGEVARNAIITKTDLELYQAVFELSEIKEDPHSTPEQIAGSQRKFEEMVRREVKPSEAALLTRMAWWTTEYGLIEVKGEPLIYGAGLLSSISESYHCLSDEVKKIPFSMKSSINTSYDITRPQPQLFVAKDFKELTVALDDFANTMAFRQGGAYGLRLGVEAQNTVTAALDSGVQLTGILKDPLFTGRGEEAGFILSGTKQVSFADHEIAGIPLTDFPDEILIPLFDATVASQPEDMLRKALEGAGLETKTGLKVTGRVKSMVNAGAGAKIFLLENIRFLGSNGRAILTEDRRVYPLPIASRIASVFGGAADRKNFVLKNRKAPSKKVKSHKTNLTPENRELNGLYRKVRDFRESGSEEMSLLDEVLTALAEMHPEDWLLRLELLELYLPRDPGHPNVAKLRQELSAL
ncbi:MAG: aromatic amino acid hydroxylase, partial [Proteobacteria bacterium]|nr:aromatic amino acid hydroxylase [Pseudomonadota bacterium]